LFGPPEQGRAASTNGSGPGDLGPSAAPFPAGAAPGPLADAVERGYRVIDDYMRQGQAFAQAFDPTPWMSSAQPGAPPDVQQLAQRVLQYGWDFVGMWFELWTRTAGGWPATPGTTPFAPFAPGAESESRPATPTSGGQAAEAATPAPKTQRIAVSIISERPTSTMLELFPGPSGPLKIHALRAESLDVPPIRDVHVESPEADGVITVKVVVSPDATPGVYNAMIIDTETNLPRGTLSLTVRGEEKR
jgi:hypothetical protein